MARVALADHHDASVATDHLAVIADLLDAGVDLHVLPSIRCPREEPFAPSGVAVLNRYLQRDLLVAVDDPAAGQVVRGQLNDHAVLREDADVVLAHLARNMGKHLVTVAQLNAEHRVGQRFDHGSFDLDDTVFFGHSLTVAQVRRTGRALDFDADETRQRRAQCTNELSYVIKPGFASRDLVTHV